MFHSFVRFSLPCLFSTELHDDFRLVSCFLDWPQPGPGMVHKVMPFLPGCRAHDPSTVESSGDVRAGPFDAAESEEGLHLKTTIGHEVAMRAAHAFGFRSALTRREFLVLAAGAVTSLAALDLCSVWGADPPIVIIDNAKGLLLADPSRCVGCLRCELACTEFNDGRAQPSLARIKIDRNLAYGPDGLSGGAPMQGAWGNGLFIQDTCRQCPHPVPCATACPENAIQADPQTGARIVNTALCVGCRLCQRACPWNMISFDEHSQKADKCFLCQGTPKCVEACPSGALHYVPWRDLAREGARRTASLSAVPPEKAKECVNCHVGR